MRISDWSSDVCSSDLLILIELCPWQACNLAAALKGYHQQTDQRATRTVELVAGAPQGNEFVRRQHPPVALHARRHIHLRHGRFFDVTAIFSPGEQLPHHGVDESGRANVCTHVTNAK